MTTDATSRFTTRPDPLALRPQAAQEEALARLHYAVDNRLKLVLLFGPPGCGKTFVLQSFAAQLRPRATAVAYSCLLGLEPRELAWSLLSQWGRRPEGTEDAAKLWRELRDQLVELRYEARPTAVLLDNLDAASPETMLFVQRLANADPAADSPLTMIGTLDWLSRSRLPKRLLDQADLRIDLEPWNPDETTAYLNAAEVPAPQFAGDAAARVHDLTDGLPRRINQLARLAVIAAEGQGLSAIDAEMIEAVQNELGLRR